MIVKKSKISCIVLLILSFLLVKSTYGQQQGCEWGDKELSKINGSKGKLVSSFLSDSSFIHYSEIVFFTAKPGVLSGIYIIYNDCPTLILTVNKFRFVNPYDISRNWNLDTFRKEIIEDIKISE